MLPGSARWALATRDGDLLGGDFPGWITELFGPGAVLPLADRRGECIHSACPHYKTCFVEHSIRRAKSAQIVIARRARLHATPTVERYAAAMADHVRRCWIER